MQNKTERVKMPEQQPDVRNQNFSEVALGYTKEHAMVEATRCLQCKKPLCVQGCPVSIDIPKFIGKIKEDKMEESYQVILESNNLPAVCGRVCPQSQQCEKECVLAKQGKSIAIGNLERYVADMHLQNVKKEEIRTSDTHHIKVAVVGSGPAGMSAAGELRKFGYDVTVFEALHEPGGVLLYGIPNFRLPKDLLKKEIGLLEQTGIHFCFNTVIGKTITIDELFNRHEFKAVFLGSGAGLPRFMNIPGKNLNGVYSSNEYLTRVNLMKAYEKGSHTPIKKARKVVVVGGGNVAMDSARTALRMGAESVTVVYRRSEEEMPARVEEVRHALEEGIRIRCLTNPVEIVGEDGNVRGLICIHMTAGERDEYGKREIVSQNDTEHFIEADVIIMAVGTRPNKLITSTTEGLDIKKWGGIIVDDDTMKTTRKGVFAGGDAVTGDATVILAMGAGKKAAKAIHEYIKNLNE